MECDNSCHFVLFYNDLKNLNILTRGYRDDEEEFLKHIQDTVCSSDDALKRYFRNAFYFSLRRQTIYNKRVDACNRHEDDSPAVKLLTLAVRSTRNDDVALSIADEMECILNSDGNVHPERLELNADVTGEEKDYRSVNWECENGMDDEANEMCNKFVETVFEMSRKQWKHSCVIDSPYNKDDALDQCCGRYFAVCLIDASYYSEEEFYACVFLDGEADYDSFDALLSKIEHNEVDVRKICKWKGLD